MGVHFFAVYIDGGPVVGGAETQEDPPGALIVRQSHDPAVPDGSHEIFVFHAGQTGLGAEGDLDGQRVGCVFQVHTLGLAGVTVVDGKFPGAV